MQHNIILPDLGQTTSEAKIVQWLKKPGDLVSRGEPIVAVATDKVDMEVESFESGYLRKLLVAEGSMVSALASVAILTDTPEEAYDGLGEQKAMPAPAAPVAQSAVAPTTQPRGNAAPAARALARDLGVDLAQVEGTGPKGLITRADVLRFSEAVAAPNRTLSAMAAMAATTANSKRDIPHFYATRDLEVASAARWRDRWNETQTGARASFNDVFVWCAAKALGDAPRLNVAYKDGAFEQRSAADVLLVVAREPALLLLPMADSRALDWKEFIHRMHDGAGQGMSAPGAPLLAISNLGMYGVKEFAAIIPPGCSSVLSIGAVRDAPVVRNGAVTVEKIATVTLSADHRVIDGIAAARFLERIQFHLNSL
jgi:pyruvate dehydrogenase E2 component (dihydrolipoamide acetyltransferase)